MKIKVIKPAFYQLEYLKVGRIIDIKEKELPSWAEPLKKENKKQAESAQNKPTENTNIKEDNEPTTPTEPDEQTENSGQQEEQTEQQSLDIPNPEADMYLELLLNEAIAKDIVIQDADKKSVPEQIKELEELLGIDKDKVKCV